MQRYSSSKIGIGQAIKSKVFTLEEINSDFLYNIHSLNIDFYTCNKINTVHMLKIHKNDKNLKQK